MSIAEPSVYYYEDAEGNMQEVDPEGSVPSSAYIQKAKAAIAYMNAVLEADNRCKELEERYMSRGAELDDALARERKANNRVMELDRKVLSVDAKVAGLMTQKKTETERRVSLANAQNQRLRKELEEAQQKIRESLVVAEDPKEEAEEAPVPDKESVKQNE